MHFQPRCDIILLVRSYYPCPPISQRIQSIFHHQVILSLLVILEDKLMAAKHFKVWCIYLYLLVDCSSRVQVGADRESRSVLFDMQGAQHVLTSSIYGASHDLRRKILGACKPSDTPLRSLSYHCVDLCRCSEDMWRWHTRTENAKHNFIHGTLYLVPYSYTYMQQRIFYYYRQKNVSIPFALYRFVFIIPYPVSICLLDIY